MRFDRKQTQQNKVDHEDDNDGDGFLVAWILTDSSLPPGRRGYTHVLVAAAVCATAAAAPAAAAIVRVLLAGFGAICGCAGAQVCRIKAILSFFLT